MKKLYVIAGCNGAGKTTASYTVLPDILDCKEFVNADEIARGLSPFNPGSVSIDAGRLMLSRIKELLESGEDFAFETTLSTRFYSSLIKKAQKKGYFVTILFFWLESPDLAIKRVHTRVQEGGHSVRDDVVVRRYEKGIINFFELYLPVCDNWILVDNSLPPFKLIANGHRDIISTMNDPLTFNRLKNYGK